VGQLSQYSVWLQTGRPGFDPRQSHRIFPQASCVQTGSEDHPASYPIGTGGKARLGRDANHSPHLVLRSSMSRSYISSLCRLNGGNGTALLLFFTYWNIYRTIGEPGSSVSVVSGYGLDDREIEVRSSAKVKGFFLYPLCLDRLWGPPRLLCNWYWGSFLRS
jgi:hypothetical protein